MEFVMSISGEDYLMKIFSAKVHATAFSPSRSLLIVSLGLCCTILNCEIYRIWYNILYITYHSVSWKNINYYSSLM